MTIEETKRVLIIDDEETNRKLFSAIVEKHGYEYENAVNGQEGLDKMDGFKPHLILLDVMMPVMNGYEFLEAVKKDEEHSRVPVIMLTALTDRESRHKGLEMGAVDFLSKPIDMTEFSIRVKNVLQVKEYQDFLRQHNEILEETVARRTSDLKIAFLDSIYRLTIAAEYKDEDTALHIKRISRYVEVFAELLGYSEEEVEVMSYASPMHDVGKIGIPDAILFKKGPLSEEEFNNMQNHTIIGGKILSGSDSEYLKSAAKFALYHHEKYDGSGYPHGLKGEDIPMEGRMLTIVDQYDALRSKRVYKEGFSHEKAMEIITEGDDRTNPKDFDPRLMDIFLANESLFDEIFLKYKD